MKKFLNDVDAMLEQSLRGFAAAHADIVTLNQAPVFFYRNGAPALGRVAPVSGGGSGHEPLHGGYVGAGMLAAACPGPIFTAPTPDQILAAAAAVDAGAGVLFIVKNYPGDVMNFEIAAEDYRGRHATVLVDDDVASAAGRRGVAGTLVVEKMIGAAAAAGIGLDACAALGARVAARTRSMGVALAGCTVPTTGRTMFALGAEEIELGVGIHGEPGRRRAALDAADAIAATLADAVVGALAPPPGARALLLLNGFGATPQLELNLMYDAARRALGGRVDVARSLVGSYVTSLDTAGCSLTLTLLDDELAAYWDAPVHTAALRWGC